MFKKLLAATAFAAVIGTSAFAPVQEATAGDKGGLTPALFSFFFPGTGEWYNSDFDGGFPVVECLVSGFCFPFYFSSIIDAAAGVDDREIRFDFWSPPAK